jgi:nucleotide-binding universal stress UspA family protein
MYKRILVPLDGSELAEQVLPDITQLAGCTGAQVALVRIPSEPLYDYLVPDPEVALEMRRDIELGAETYLEEIASELRSMGLDVVYHVVWGAPVAATLLQVAQELEVDLIAMSTHGRSGLARLMIGSVADEVVRNSPVPVLLLRPEPPRGGRPEKEKVTAGRAVNPPTPRWN